MTPACVVHGSEERGRVAGCKTRTGDQYARWPHPDGADAAVCKTTFVACALEPPVRRIYEEGAPSFLEHTELRAIP